MVEKILEPYAQKSYKKYKEKYMSLGLSEERAEEETLKNIERDFEQMHLNFQENIFHENKVM